MVLWFVFVLMTAAAAFAVLWPLARNKPLRQGGDVAVYRDQLDEIQRDRASGLIGPAEAEAARVEVSRRLIVAADAAAAAEPAEAKTALLHRRVTAIAGLVLLPVGALALYLAIGSPDLPGEPLAWRAQTAEANNLQNMVAQVEDHVAKNPNDAKGWEVLAPVYMRIGRYDAAVRAWHNVIALAGSTAEREANYGEAVVAAANGVVTDEAKAAFDRALKIEPDNVMARFYKGMAADQDGKRAEAEKIWNDLIAKAPPGATWVEVVKRALARDAQPPGAPAPQAQGAPPADHDLNAMVEKLAERLQKDGSDVNGWLQLVRSYRVLGQTDKMQAALEAARKALAGDADKLKAFNDGAVAATSAVPAAAPAPPAQAAAPPASLAQDHSIVDMVQRLADRLKKDGSDVSGWLQLVRSYRVMEQTDKMQGAIADARKALASDPDKLKQFNAGVDAAMTVSAAPPAPAPAAVPGQSAADVKAAGQMNADQRDEMIRGMVAKLADKLKADGSDLAGWEQLLRAYMVLGERDKASAAAADARKALSGDPDKLRALDAVIKDLKVEG